MYIHIYIYIPYNPPCLYTSNPVPDFSWYRLYFVYIMYICISYVYIYMYMNTYA